MAFSRLNSTGSMAMMFVAPAALAPCTALAPTPPIPTTTTVSPGFTPARFTAEPYPVATPQLTRQTTSRGRSGSTLMTEASARHIISAKVPSLAMVVMGLPSVVWCRNVPSVTMPPANVPAPRSHRLVLPMAHQWQRPHDGMNEVDTWSPGWTVITPSPTASTIPEPSWPPSTGNHSVSSNISNASGGGTRSPVSTCSSEWHSPANAVRTSTSPALGSPSSNSSTLQSLPTSWTSAP